MELADKIKQFPALPGVYIMRDASAEIIYIGKARSLRQRVRQYFASSGDSRQQIRFLVARVADIEIMLTDTEKEALLLENTLIKQHRPRYNLNLKDDKTYFSLRIDSTEQFPRFSIIRKVPRDGARYFGPYASASAAKEVLRQLQRMFPLRHYPLPRCMSRKRPCLYHQIGQCSAPCCNMISAEDYGLLVDGAMLFLEGKNRQLVTEFKRRMLAASEELRFEEAARWRNLLRAIDVTVERQKMVTRGGDSDVIGFSRSGSVLEITLLFVRGGTVTGSRHFPLQWELESETALAEFVRSYYTEDAFVPEEILLPLELDESAALAEVLSDIRGRRVALFRPLRGMKRELVGLAGRNAEVALREREEKQHSMDDTLIELKERLHLQSLPRRMECYDISNIQGRFVVGSGVVFLDGRGEKSLYRRYRIRGVDGQDDFASLSEVFSRRFAGERIAEYGLPDLVVVDGGIGQLNAAVEIVRGLGLEGRFDLVSLAKSRTESDLAAEDIARSDERVFLPGRRNPVVLRQNSKPLLLLAALRNEAHRFAIGYHRQLRSREGTSSGLDQVSGIGPKRRIALLKHFGSLQGMTAATLEQIAAVPGVGGAAAKRLYEWLHAREEGRGINEL